MKDVVGRLRSQHHDLRQGAYYRPSEDPTWDATADAADEIEALRSLIRAAVEIGVLDDLGFRGKGVSTSLLPGEWSGVIARAEATA